MKNIRLVPGSMGVAAHAVDLFGAERVNPGSWTTPVWVTNLSDDEVMFAKEFFAEYNISVEELAENEVPR